MPGPVGRPRKHAQFDQLVAGLPDKMEKRPRYVQGIGVFRGQRGLTAWVKVYLPHGTTYQSKAYPPRSSVEIKAGRLDSFSWDQLIKMQADLQARADRGEALEDKEIPRFSDWSESWLKRAKQRAKAADTLDIHINKHLIPSFGGQRLNEISATDVNRWISDRLKTAQPGTVKRQFNTLRAILNDAVKGGLIEKNPCAQSDQPKGGAARQRFLDGPEIVKLLATAAGVADWLPDAIAWAIHSGMRKGEFRSLRWQDVRVLDEQRTVVLIPTSKSGQPRTVPCTSTMKEILERQGKRRVKDDDRVFPISAMTLRRKWEKARETAGLGDVNIHDLRRTHGTHAAAAGVDLRTLAARIGHTDLTMLERHYAALVGSAATEAADTFQKRFDQLINVQSESKTS